MINAFDADIAMEVGMAAAVLYRNIQYWCEKNRTNGMHEHEGLFWTYNSTKAYCEQFPYMNAKQIRRALMDLEEHGYIKSGIFNENGRDRTKWYADLRFNKNNIEVPESGTCICPNGKMQDPKQENAFAESGQPLPNNYLQITTTNKKEVSKKVSSGNNARAKEPSFDEILDSVDVIKDNPELREAFVNFIKMRKVIKAQLSNRGLELAINRAFKIGKGDPVEMVKIINQSVERSWRGIFPLTDSTIEPKSHEQIAREAQAARSVNPYTDLKKELGIL